MFRLQVRVAVRIKLHETRGSNYTHLAEQDMLSSWRHWEHRPTEVFAKVAGKCRNEGKRWLLNGIQTSSTARMQKDAYAIERINFNAEIPIPFSFSLSLAGRRRDGWPRNPSLATLKATARSLSLCPQGDPKSYFQPLLLIQSLIGAISFREKRQKIMNIPYFQVLFCLTDLSQYRRYSGYSLKASVIYLTTTFNGGHL